MLRRKWISIAVGVAVASFSMGVQAMDRGQNSPFDHRVKTVQYNPMDTVEVDGVVGVATHIEVAPDEQYVTHAFGQSGGWAFSHKDNHFFLRPQEEHSDTNLTIVTNKRRYYILLNYIGSYTVEENGEQVEKFIETPWTMRAATVGLVYEYPMEDMQKANEEAERMRVQQALNEADPGQPVNLNYRMSDETDSHSIQPLNAWDNYEFTYFRFPQNAALPTIFVIGPDGREAMVNASVEGEHNNVMVVQQTAREWRIRYGDRVVGVVNDGYNPSIGGTTTGTVSQRVERVVKESEGEP